MEKKTEQQAPGLLAGAYEKPEVKDFGDLFELTAGGSIRGGHDQLYPNNPKAVKCVVTCFS
jgi:hypothetical protein